jgi:hypothetical protein
MECEKCHRERAHGRTYRFYYGTKGRPERSVEWDLRVTRTPIRVAGQESVWLCQRCVWLLSDLGVGLSVGVLVVFSGLLVSVGLVQRFLEPSSQFAMGGACLAAVALPLLVFSLGTGIWYARWGKRRTKPGERLAIRLRKAALQRQGYDTFLTTEQYNRLGKPG